MAVSNFAVQYTDGCSEWPRPQIALFAQKSHRGSLSPRQYPARIGEET